MASTLQNAVGYQTGYQGDVGAETGSPSENGYDTNYSGTYLKLVTNPVYSGNYALHLAADTTTRRGLRYVINSHLSGSAPSSPSSGADVASGDYYTWIGVVRFTNLSPAGNYEFWAQVSSGGLSPCIRMRLTTAGNLEVRDAPNTSTMCSLTTPFTVDTWHTIRLDWRNHDTLGEARVTVDPGLSGPSATSSATYDTFGATNSRVWTIYNFATSGTGQPDLYLDCAATWKNTQLVETDIPAGIAISPTYLSGTNSATDLGDTLDTGTWTSTNTLPMSLTTFPGGSIDGASDGFICGTDTDTSGNGGVVGPNGTTLSPEYKSTIASKVCFRGERSGGQGDTHTMYWGSSSGAWNTADMTDMYDIDLELSQTESFRMAVVGNNGNAGHPSSTDYMRYGFGKGTGGQSLICIQMNAALFYEPSFGWVGTIDGVTGPASIIGVDKANIDAVMTVNKPG